MLPPLRILAYNATEGLNSPVAPKQTWTPPSDLTSPSALSTPPISIPPPTFQFKGAGVEACVSSIVSREIPAQQHDTPTPPKTHKRNIEEVNDYRSLSLAEEKVMPLLKYLASIKKTAVGPPAKKAKLFEPHTPSSLKTMKASDALSDEEKTESQSNTKRSLRTKPLNIVKKERTLKVDKGISRHAILNAVVNLRHTAGVKMANFQEPPDLIIVPSRDTVLNSWVRKLSHFPETYPAAKVLGDLANKNEDNVRNFKKQINTAKEKYRKEGDKRRAAEMKAARLDETLEKLSESATVAALLQLQTENAKLKRANAALNKTIQNGDQIMQKRKEEFFSLRRSHHELQKNDRQKHARLYGLQMRLRELEAEKESSPGFTSTKPFNGKFRNPVVDFAVHPWKM